MSEDRYIEKLEKAHSKQSERILELEARVDALEKAVKETLSVNIALPYGLREMLQAALGRE